MKLSRLMPRISIKPVLRPGPSGFSRRRRYPEPSPAGCKRNSLLAIGAFALIASVKGIAAWDRSDGQRKAAAEGKPRAMEASGMQSGRAKGREDGNVAVGIADARLVRSAGEPAWLVEDSQGRRFALSALDGKPRVTTPELAVKIAENWFGGVIKASYLDTVEKPIILRNQDALSPFHRIAVGDDGGELLVSSRTGEVLHASTRMDRAFYWTGNWLHLLKPLDSIGLGKIRNDVQLWLGLSATIATLTGLIIGWLRWRPGFGGKKTYSQGRTQPYREFWFKWHFWSGLIGGTVVLFWTLSRCETGVE